MIPKIVHTCWFGKQAKSPLIQKCLDSQRKYLPDYIHKEWHEDNIDMGALPPTIQESYARKKWAFVSDFVRLQVLYEEGGIYLDSDMEVIKPLDRFLAHSFFLGCELPPDKAAAGIIGSLPQHEFVGDCLQIYQQQKQIRTIPLILQDALKQNKEGIRLYPPVYFYPLPPGETRLQKSSIKPETHTIHWWNNSWDTGFMKLLRKMPIFRAISSFLEDTKVKKYFKKIFMKSRV